MYKSAKLVQFELTQKNLYQGAVTIRNKWELNNKPRCDEIAGIPFSYTAIGWPIVYNNGDLDCPKTWSLLSNGIEKPEYNTFSYIKAGDSVAYNTCLYDMDINNKLAIFYINDRIHIVSNLSL
ncbi:conserved hypothetical protein [Photobacterium leiognathi lrivu.4.1]|uniref:Uncharacterized protein n=1 Tax=Photobacterium leiognathi lrivu.4.1 TaxID=1248232 RepID=A0A0U1P972_PHOLE|nr:conserved hypothetical protein [Photobacterium leiognathi lrivu.4.1]